MNSALVVPQPAEIGYQYRLQRHSLVNIIDLFWKTYYMYTLRTIEQVIDFLSKKNLLRVNLAKRKKIASFMLIPQKCP